MKVKVTKFIDLCRQYMKNDLEQELDDEIYLNQPMEQPTRNHWHIIMIYGKRLKHLMIIFALYFLI